MTDDLEDVIGSGVGASGDPPSPPAAPAPRAVRRGRKGVPGGFTKDLRALVLTAMELEGGVGGALGYLRKAAREDRPAFLKLVAKMMPQKVEADVTMMTLEKIVGMSWDPTLRDTIAGRS